MNYIPINHIFYEYIIEIIPQYNLNRKFMNIYIYIYIYIYIILDIYKNMYVENLFNCYHIRKVA